MTAGRTYLSIGDVLTLLRQEFPDVTISKIRFLESQGLVNPERTPSGYRKFYDHDVERLRWVLRQQREHFLPLKVIKGRLDDGTSSAESTTTTEPSARIGNGRRSADSGAINAGEAMVGSGGADGGDHISRRGTAVGLEDRVVSDPSTSDGSRETPGHLPGFDPPAGGESLERHLSGEGAGERNRAPYSTGEDAQSTTPQHSPQGAQAAQSGLAQSGAGRPLGTAAAGGSGRPAGQATASQGPVHAGHVVSDRTFGGGLKAPWAPTVGTTDKAVSPDTWHPSGSGRTRSGAHESQVPAARPFSGTRRTADSRSHREGSGRFTVAEIAAAAGLTESVIEELESFGILSCRMVGGVAHFDESELAIARVAADFAQFGIEPRHLRLYKHASEREAGFVEQLVLPLLKQRNPEQRAEEMVSDLTRLGEGLRAAIVRRSLQDLLGG